MEHNTITTSTEIPSKTIVQTLTDSFTSLKNGDVTRGLTTLIQEMVIPATIGLLSLILVYFVAKMIARRVSTVICRRVDETLGKFIGKVLFYSIIIIACIAILARQGFEVSGFMAVLATAGFAIGLAFQGTLSNFSAGILLLVFRPFKVGDMVNIALVTGKVNEIDIFTTTLDTPDNRRLIIPNSTITSGTIENISFHPVRRIEVLVGVEYGANIEKTRLAITEAIESMIDVVIPGEGRGYQIMLNNLGPSSVDWTVRVWVDRENIALAKERLTCQIKLSLAKYQIAIPFPQLHLHMTPESAQLPVGGDSRADLPSLSIPEIHSSSPTKVRPRVRGENAERAN